MLHLVLMVKNEEDTVLKTLNSVTNQVTKVIVLDTGSTDRTLDVIKNYCKENKKHFYILEKQYEPFDFSIARNDLLHYADSLSTVEDYYLLLDANDVVITEINILEELKRKQVRSGVVDQVWKSEKSEIKYVNVRIIKAKRRFRYKYPVHEVIEDFRGDYFETTKLPIVLFQDRSETEEFKSSNRFINDEKALKKYYKQTKDLRCLFYLAQTQLCLANTAEERRKLNDKLPTAKDYARASYDNYKKRSSSTSDKFPEEIYESLIRCVVIGMKYGFDNKTIIEDANRAYEISCKIFEYPRAEPLILLAQFYYKKDPFQVYRYLKRACELPVPKDVKLFLDLKAYSIRHTLLENIINNIKHCLDRNVIKNILGYDL